MPFVKCTVDGCNARLQPISKPIPNDKSTWVFRECDRCLRPACEEHSAEVGGQIVCHRCRRAEQALRIPIDLIAPEVVQPERT